jgi:hypothetical protein
MFSPTGVSYAITDVLLTSVGRLTFGGSMTDRNRIAGYMFLCGIKWGVLVGAVSGAIMGLPVFLIGALFGIVIGGLVGIFVGMVTGAITGIITVAFFYSPKEVFRYRLVMAVVSLAWRLCIHVSGLSISF